MFLLMVAESICVEACLVCSSSKLSVAEKTMSFPSSLGSCRLYCGSGCCCIQSHAMSGDSVVMWVGSEVSEACSLPFLVASTSVFTSSFHGWSVWE